MREAVRDVAKYFPTAIVSGRSRDKVHFIKFLNKIKKIYTLIYIYIYICWISIYCSLHNVNLQVHSFVRLSELYYAGSHGMDIKGPAKGHKHRKVSNNFHVFSSSFQVYFISSYKLS